MSRISKRPSPALIVAVVALVAALAGTAIAGPGASTSKITKAKVKKVANKQIDKRLPLGTADLADSAVTTPKIANGAVSGAKLGEVLVRKVEQPLADGGNAAFNVSCTEGEKMVGGGARVLGGVANQDYELQSSGPTVPGGQEVPEEGAPLQAWRIAAHNEAGGGGDTTAVAFALCMVN